jgi:hypothetical protein
LYEREEFQKELASRDKRVRELECELEGLRSKGVKESLKKE